MGQIIDGKAVSAQVKERIRVEVEELKKQGVEIGLAVVIVGDDPASQVYVRNKEKACEVVGINSYKYALPAETTEEELLALVEKLNNDDRVDGILVQLPLPKHLDDKIIINNIRPDKDVDAFHPVNVGKIMIGEYSYLPCTPAGVMALIASTGTEIAGKECAVITCCEENDLSVMDGVRIPIERTAALLKWNMIGEVLVPGVLNAGEIEKTDGCRQAAELAEKI